MQNKYTVKEQQGENALLKDNKPVFCPFIPPYPVPNQFGNVSMTKDCCNTTCPHASFENNVYSITCGCKELSFEIEKEKPKMSSIIGEA